MLWSKEGTLMAAVWGPVIRGLPQTSAAAEHSAIMALTEILADQLVQPNETAKVHTDYAGAVKAWAQPMAAAAADKAYGGLYRVAASRVKPSLVDISWVKGHALEKMKDLEGEELWKAQGNDQADKYAAKGREIHEMMRR